MPESLSADRTAELLLWYFEEPARYRAEGRRRDAPLLDAGVVLKLALGRRVDFAQHAFNEARALATLRDAAALYVRFLFFRPEATPYQILGLAPGASAAAIKESFRLLMHLVHPDRQDARVVWPDSFAALANRAHGILKDQDARVKFDREAEARAAMARAINRSASASVASKMPVVQRTRPRFGRGRALPRATLPEWLTAGVGGLARNHPSATAFTALVAAAALSVGVMVWDKHEEALMRDVDAGSERNTATSYAGPKLSWFGAPKSSASAPVASQSGVSAGRSPSVDTRAQGRGVRSTAADAATPLASVAQPVPAVGRTPAPDAVAGATGAQSSASVALDQPGGNTASPRAPIADASAPAPPIAVAKGVATGVAKPDPALSPPPQAASAEPPSAPVATSAGAASQSVVTHSVVATAAAGGSPGSAAMTTARAELAVTAVLSPVAPSPPATSEIETLFAMFVESYERGRVDAFADLFDLEAEANLRQGRTAIRSEYDELFRLSQWRKMQLTRVNWKRVGNRAVAKGEITVRIGWRDGREVEQRLAMDMELVRRDGRVVIARMSQQPRN